MKAVKIKGIDKVMRNLNREFRNIETRSKRGMLNAAAYIRYDTTVTPPTIPWKTGNLSGSWFVTPMGKKGIIMGYGANYAVYVHERVEGAPWGDGVVGDIKWHKKGSGPKWFQAAINRNHDKILELIANG